jgi:hypothetical protein
MSSADWDALLPEVASIVASIPTNADTTTMPLVYHHQQPEPQQQQFVQYQAECLQHGKRKFHDFFDHENQLETNKEHQLIMTTAASTAPIPYNGTASSTMKEAIRSDNKKCVDHEAGLSLLFAASLLQQQDLLPLQQSTPTSTSTMPHDTKYPVISSSPARNVLDDVYDSNKHEMEYLEPTANDGTYKYSSLSAQIASFSLTKSRYK